MNDSHSSWQPSVQYPARALHPRPEGRGFPRKPDNNQQYIVFPISSGYGSSRQQGIMIEVKPHAAFNGDVIINSHNGNTYVVWAHSSVGSQSKVVYQFAESSASIAKTLSKAFCAGMMSKQRGFTTLANVVRRPKIRYTP
ncbi:hypothetical protein HAP94_13285 [Acidithiobacillus ferrivorans]|nr:hypothetical protein [Acidithiobacillus ferrivorans]